MNTSDHNSKKILIVCTSLNMGGAENQAVWLANTLNKKGYKVFFISLKQKGILNEKLDSGIAIRNFKIANSRNKITKLVNTFSAFLQTIKLIRKNRIRKAVSFLFHANVFVKIISIFLFFKLDHIVAVRNDRLSKRDSNSSKIRNLIFKKFVINKSTFIVFNSQAGIKKFKLDKKYNQKVIFNAPLNSPQINHEKNDKFIYIGRLDELKNTPELLKAINILKKSGIIVNLEIYGSGPDLSNLKKYVSNNKLESQIEFKGLNLLISNNINRYKALLLTSTHEGFPNVIIEAMNSKTICISTKVGDVEYLLSNNRGILINGFDSHSISKSIELFLNLSSNKLEEIQNKAESFVKSELNEEIIFNQWKEVIYPDE